jgi:hypothetical protein
MNCSRFVLCVLASTLAGFAQAADSPTLAEPVGSYQLKNRSKFTAPETARPPFWPIGYVKRGPVTEAAVITRMNVSPDMFSLTSISVGNPSLAIINGRPYGEGEYLRTAVRGGLKSVPADPRQRISVSRIVDGHVVLQTGDGQVVNVPLRRPELTERKPDQESEVLLNEDR